MPEEKWMQVAIEAAQRGMAAGQTPFGACIVRGDRLIIATHNHVFANTDITAHAEVHAIRKACAALGTIDLSGCEIYSTCEPCPMCFAACHWARLDRIIFGATIADAAGAGFNELPVSNESLKVQGNSRIEVAPQFMQGRCADLFRQWLAMPGRRTY